MMFQKPLMLTCVLICLILYITELLHSSPVAMEYSSSRHASSARTVIFMLLSLYLNFSVCNRNSS